MLNFGKCMSHGSVQMTNMTIEYPLLQIHHLQTFWHFHCESRVTILALTPLACLRLIAETASSNCYHIQNLLLYHREHKITTQILKLTEYTKITLMLQNLPRAFNSISAIVILLHCLSHKRIIFCIFHPRLPCSDTSCFLSTVNCQRQ